MLVIYSKLDIAARDRAWIEDVRRRHDRQQLLVEPHVTFVFPFDSAPTGEVIAHAQAVAAGTPPIPFRLSRVAAVRDQFGDGSHLFLLPDEGDLEMRDLHRRLYTGVLAHHLHPTAIYTPHVTVGVFERHEDAELAAAPLAGVDIRGELNSILIAGFDGSRVEEVHQAPLTRG